MLMSAEVTRTRVRDAGHSLFVSRGYTAVSLQDVADAADVPLSTVHSSYPTKVALFRDALSAAIAGPSSVADRAVATAVLTPLRANDIIETTAAGAAALLTRAGALIMAGVHASGGDDEMRVVAREGETAQRATLGTVASALVATGSVRPDFTPQEVADILVGLCSPHLHHLLGWPEDRYRYWLTSTMCASLLR
jgi:AcrR family transcriptional regulator